jgi:hypothetical protein
MKKKAILAVVTIVGVASVYGASEWWERALATYESSEFSPDGCFRVDTFKPFWVLPSNFHISPHPDPTMPISLGRTWENAVFRRAVELSTGNVLGETVVFDPVGPAPLIFWNEPAPPGRRIVYANQFPLFDSDRCADVATLARLEAYQERKREEDRARQDGRKAEQDVSNPPAATDP